jgi:hypothetical protein
MNLEVNTIIYAWVLFLLNSTTKFDDHNNCFPSNMPFFVACLTLEVNIIIYAWVFFLLDLTTYYDDHNSCFLSDKPISNLYVKTFPTSTNIPNYYFQFCDFIIFDSIPDVVFNPCSSNLLFYFVLNFYCDRISRNHLE